MGGGGYICWLDVDTIVTGSDFFDSIEDQQCCMIGIPSQALAHIAFIYTRDANSEFISKWADEIVRRVAHFCKVKRFKWFYKKLHRQDYQATHNWDFVGNAVINSLVPQMSKENYTLLDRQEIVALLEYSAPFYQEGCDVMKLYTDFYFQDYGFKEILAKNKGIVLLHNSWTPAEYKQMSEADFLSQDITLAKILKYLLEI